jgi:hypothetical protein
MYYLSPFRSFTDGFEGELVCDVLNVRPANIFILCNQPSLKGRVKYYITLPNIVFSVHPYDLKKTSFSSNKEAHNYLLSLTDRLKQLTQEDFDKLKLLL